MVTPLEIARDSAIATLLTAVRIVRNYSQEKFWLQSANCLTIPSLAFGDFLREVIEAETAVEAVANQLVDAKRDDQIVRFGKVCERTAHQVAVRFARQVGTVIWLNLWTEGEEGAEPPSTASEPWPIDGLMSDQCHREFVARWRDIHAALATIEVGSMEEMLPLILLESRRAQQIQRKSDPDADRPKQISKKMPDNPDVRDLCALLSANAGKLKLMEVARNFTKEVVGKDKKAKSLLRQAQRYPHLWRDDK